MLRRIILILLLLTGTSWSEDTPVLMTGAIGGGLFLPTGEDADVADLSPSIEMSASVTVAEHFGFEVEFVYIPIQLEDGVLTSHAFSKSSQMSLLGGIRFASGLPGQGRPTATLSIRGGFARVASVARFNAAQGGWIGGSIDQIENPTVNLPPNRTTDKAVALSPRVGVLFPLTGMSAVELGISPVFIFNRGGVSTQIQLGLRFALSTQGTM